MDKVTIRLKSRETGQVSKEVSIEKIIYNQSSIEFEFGEFDDEDYGTLPYNDFLFFRDEYDVIIKIKGDGNDTKSK